MGLPPCSDSMVNVGRRCTDKESKYMHSVDGVSIPSVSDIPSFYGIIYEVVSDV